MSGRNTAGQVRRLTRAPLIAAAILATFVATALAAGNSVHRCGA
jgi:hypothetical protein